MPDRILKVKIYGLRILSEKIAANDGGKAIRVNDEGNEGLAILCSSLLIVFQSFSGFVKFDDKRVEL